MNPQLHSDILRNLDRDYGFKAKDGWLRQGKCPSCDKKELYTREDKPWVLRCGRLNKCGAEYHVKEIYPDLFNSWSERHPPTPANPNAAAEAYLRDGRGFDLPMAGWYSQESYWSKEKNAGSATVRFQIGDGVWWERIIDQPQRFGNRKATFRGEYKGLWWQAPTGLGEAKEIWIVEGIFDAIALMHHGITAVAAMSSVNYPDKMLAALAAKCAAEGVARPALVWALDGDASGQRFGRKGCERSRKEGWEASVAMIEQSGPSKLDWNDMHQRDRLQDQNIKEYRYQGELLMANSATDKAVLMYGRHGWSTFPFDFDNRIFWWKLDLEKLNKVQEALESGDDAMPQKEAREKALLQSNTVTEICNCLPRPLYYLKNEVTDEAWYYFLVDFPHDGASIKNTFTAGQLSAVSEFKKRLLHSGAGAIWTGNAQQLDRLLSRWTFNIKTVQTIDFTGYTIEHGCYVFNDVAVKDGRVVEMNAEDYFELGKLSIKSLSRSMKLDINPEPKEYNTDWFDRLYLCFGPKGVISLAYWLGSLFAEQIRNRFESFPFMEIVGEPGAGKTTLLETMWKLLGRNGYEGFDPMKGSQVGFLRSMAQVSNLPVVLIESDREEDADGSKGRPKQAFHWDSLKSLYNGGSLRTTGVKSSGNDTYEPQFRGALVISQNAPVQASTPIMERIVHVGFDKSRQSAEGRDAATELGRMVAKDVSGFLIKAITNEAKVLDMIEKNQREFEKRLEAAGVKNQRIQKNHAQIMVFIHALSLVCPITQSIQTEAIKSLADLALERERDLAKDHPLVEKFWEAYEFLNGTGADDADESEGCEPRLNHHRNSDLIAINLNHFVMVAAEMRQQVPDMHDLKRLLKTSRQRKFVEITTVNSAINGRYNALKSSPGQTRPSTLKCWVFKRS